MESVFDQILFYLSPACSVSSVTLPSWACLSPVVLVQTPAPQLLAERLSRKLLLLLVFPMLLTQLPFSLECDRITNCLEGCFTAFIEMGFKLLLSECINWRRWHQRAFHRVEKTNIRILHAFVVTSQWCMTYWHSTDSSSPIVGTAVVGHIHPCDWADRSILNRAVSHNCISTEFGKSKLKLGARNC